MIACCYGAICVHFSASIRQNGQVTVVDLTGHLTSFESVGLHDTIGNLVRQGRKRIILNLSKLEYLDSSGIGLLVRNYMTVIKAGGEMKVVGLSARVEEILKITKLSQVLAECQDEEAALRSLVDNHPRKSE
jgi:anti-sigma B factor antagonist